MEFPFRVLLLYRLLVSYSLCELSWFWPGNPLTGFKAAPGAPWPMPQDWVNSSVQMTLDPVTFQITSDVPDCDVIDSAIQRYKVYLDLDPSGATDPDLPQLTGLTIAVEDKQCGSDYFPQFNMNESYSLTIDDGSTAALSSPTIWGALRGLETFSQLLYLTNDKKYRINQTTITDWPRFPYRGLLIDTSRHFLPVNVILTVLDAMSWDKFNVLHWHISDDPSFPYTSRTYPNLTKGAYSPHHVYSRENISTIINEARLRGIRVMPELDSPGHSWSWGQGYPASDAVLGEGLEGGPYKPNYPYHSASEMMNPIDENTYSFMASLFQEIIEDFPDEFVHLGMDSASLNCWNSNPNISDWMDEMGYTDIMDVLRYYDQRLVSIVSGKGARVAVYQDPVDYGVQFNTSSTFVEVFHNPWEDNVLRITTMGHYVILSTPWYLNYISYGQDWINYYNVEPYSFTDDPNLQQLVQGGEVCMWGEYIDGTNLMSTTWPRASTAAERLWSDQSVHSADDAKYRLDQQRCRMDRRRVPAQSLMNGYCGDYEWTF